MSMLESILEIRGVRHVALLDTDGRILGAAGRIPDAGAVMASVTVTEHLLGAMPGSELRDMVIDFEDGPVLLTNVGGQTLYTAFDDVANLGRIRYAIKKASAAVAAR